MCVFLRPLKKGWKGGAKNVLGKNAKTVAWVASSVILFHSKQDVKQMSEPSVKNILTKYLSNLWRGDQTFKKSF